MPARLAAELAAVGERVAADVAAAGPFRSFGPALERSLGEGDAGRAWLEAALAPSGARTGALGPAGRRTLASVDDVPLDRTFGEGLAGVAVARARLGMRAAPWVVRLDHELAAILEHGEPGPGLFDGAAGVGVYALSRPPRVARRLALAFWRWLDGLLARWPTLRCKEGLAASSGFGAPAAAAVAGQLLAAGLGDAGARARTARLVAAIWAVVSRGPCEWLGHGWWKGSLGTSVALGSAACALGDGAALALAQALADEARAVSPAAVNDASLGFGALGRAHLFRRWFELTGARRFRVAALAWYRRALALRGADGPGGYVLSTASAETCERPGLWIGGCGIALAMLSATGHARDDWDVPLLGAFAASPEAT
jgi:hypothetical protein